MTTVTSYSVGERRRARLATRWRALFWSSVALMTVGCLVGIAVPAGTGWDFANFYDTGRRVAAGQIADLYDPSSPIGGARPQGNMGFWGTPISSLFYVPLSWFPPATALILFKIQNVAAFVAAFAVLFVLCRRFADESGPARLQFAAVFAFLCLIYQPFWTVFRVGGQTTPTVLLLFTLVLVAHVHAHDWIAAACVVLATLIKPALAPALLCLGLLAGRAFLARIALLVAASGALSVAVLGWPIHMTFLDTMRSGLQAPFSWEYNSSLYILPGSLQSALGSRAHAAPYAVLLGGLHYLLKAIALVTIGRLVIQARSRHWTAPAWRHFSVVVSILFFLWWSLTIWEHYLALLFIPLIYVVASWRFFARPALWLVGVVFAVSLGQNFIVVDWLRHQVDGSVFLLLAATVFKATPLILMLVFVWRHGRELHASYEAPAWTLGSTAGSR